MMKLKKIAFLAMSALALAACGGGTSTIDTLPAIDKAPHIKATVGGTAFNALADAVYGDSMPRDAAAKWLDIFGYVNQSESMVEELVIFGIPNAKGVNYPCKPAAGSDYETRIRFRDDRGEVPTSSFADGRDGSSCSITVEEVSETEVSGRFTATLIESSAAASPKAVKVDGTFRVPLNETR